jgi:2-C-methyl-D-erythritol 4-phosphate cytidylyltransferase
MKNRSVGAILLAGGIGSRMQKSEPKQFLQLGGKPVALYSFELFLRSSFIDEVIVVCEAVYESLFTERGDKSVKFARPGKERQHSVYNGLEMLSAEFACIHDSARPFIDAQLLEQVILAGINHGAAALAVPAKNTIKEATSEKFVSKTLKRKTLWEMQTPQVISKEILQNGFARCDELQHLVTDDISLAEVQGLPAKLVMGNYSNIKLTTPEDFLLAELLAKNRVVS